MNLVNVIAALAVSMTIASLFSLWCQTLAEGKKRNVKLWAVMGFLFGIIAVIVLATLPTL